MQILKIEIFKSDKGHDQKYLHARFYFDNEIIYSMFDTEENIYKDITANIKKIEV